MVEYFLRCAIGDGRSGFFWFDRWTDMGPLISAISPTGPRDLRLSLSSTVSEATHDGNWQLPAARSYAVETLQIVLSTMPPPSPTRGKDYYLWRSGYSSYDKKFSTKKTWEQIRVAAKPVSWVNLCCSGFLLGIVCLLGEMNVPTNCMLCTSGEETHDHLFFRCSYASSVWSHFCVGSFLLSPPILILECASLLRDHRFTSVPGAGSVLKLQVTIYCLWRERNAHIFTTSSSPASVLFSKIDRMVRDMLLSFPSSSQSQPSLLQLYLSFIFDVP
ncbi:uncharacterized protein LOC108808804 [Raphanus sativus]|uniref:Uncharacterized protein LOC108808804 n=1 Tax=Raphanus sativus TaxID=3726 RepID=A0A9W3BVS3_RAPSA|nr:uncharacterized protein LOC108808804 [Raphanus sativus]